MNLPEDCRLVELDNCNSTQDYIRSKKLPAWSIIRADRQSKGRGRRSRNWESPPGGLYFSISYPFRKIKTPPALQVMGAVILWIEVLGNYPALDEKNFSVKWPNDLLCRGRKLGGVLAQISGDLLYLGCGLNVNNQFGNNIADYRRTPVSLNEVTGKKYSLDKLLKRWVRQFYRAVEEDEGSIFEFETIENNMDTIGRRVRVENVEGEALRLAHDGGLVLLSEGEEKVIYAGDAVEIL